MVAEVSEGPPPDQVVQVHLLGPFSISLGGAGTRTPTAIGPWPRPSAKRLCELVFVSPGHRVGREQACEALFHGLGATAAARALSKALSMARSVLGGLGHPGPELLQADLNHIWAAPAVPLEVDLERHEEALRGALAMGPGLGRDNRLVLALAKEGVVLEDEPYADWAAGPRQRVDGLRETGRLELARDRSRGAGRSGPADVIEAWEACLSLSPACEEAAAALMRAYAAQGLRHLVVRTYERCRAALEDLGLRISPALEEIHATAAFEPATTGAAGAAPSAGPTGRSRTREDRRPVSVLFAEVVSPPGRDRVDPEELHETVGEQLARVIAEVEGLGGTVTSVSGAGLQALFGAPEAHEDDPERAVRAALRALSAPAPGGSYEAAALRMGIETGPAVVGPIGAGARFEYGAVGDVVRTAASLQSLARAGAVLVGPATRAATEGLFKWGRTGEVVPGTEPGPGAASYVESPQPGVPGRLPRRAGRAPLMGRAAELSALDNALREAERGHGSVVVLVGEPGLGKSRLVQECRKRFMAWVGASRGRLPLWLEGRCASYASTTPYGLYQHLLASWVGVAPDQGAAVVAPALEKALVAVTGNKDMWPVLARMMGLPGGAGLVRMSPVELQRATFAALRAIVSRLVSAGPTVLVLEDLHWADPTSLRLTEELAGLAAGGPLLVLATTRPDGAPDLATSDGLLAGDGAVPRHRVELGPLAGDAERDLARSLVGEAASARVLEVVLAKVEGNPLFLEERLSSLIESGALVREEGKWKLDETVGAEVPQVLERLVRSRVDRLSPTAQDVIRVASVLGPELNMPALKALCGTDDVLGTVGDRLGAALAELCRARLLEELGNAPEPTYRFRHALIQEATYRGILRAERRRLHGRAAWALEAASAGHPDEVAAVVGRHFAAAGEAERAVEYFQLAGDHAMAAFANQEAITSFRSALEIVDQDGSGSEKMAVAAVDLRAKLAEVLWSLARRDEAREMFRAAIGRTGPGDALRQARLHTRLGRMELYDGGEEAAIAAFDVVEALTGPHPGGLDDEAVDVWLEMMVDGLGWLHIVRGEPEGALTVLEAARPLLESRGRPARKTGFYRLLASQRASRDGWRSDAEVISLVRAAAAAAVEGGDQADIAFAVRDIALFSLFVGDLEEARQNFEKSLSMAERIGDQRLAANSLAGLTVTGLRRHDVEGVRSVAPRAIEACERLATFDSLALAKGAMAWLSWQEGRRPDVIVMADEAAAVFGSPAAKGFGPFKWIYLFPLLAAQLGAGRPAEAVAAARQLLDASHQRLPDELESALASACRAWDQGDLGAVGDKLADALRLANEFDFF
ncbi:MAG: AAA family ATPase [Acidimicrobiales bacterium]